MSIIDAKSLRAFKRATNFFETPPEVAGRMAELLDGIGFNAAILEPSAGRGALVRSVAERLKFKVRLYACENHAPFRLDIESAGATMVSEDFETYSPGPVFCACIMNPPFRLGADFRHVCRAWDCIRPRGRIVALVSRETAKIIDAEFFGHVFVREVLPRGTFKETPVETCLFLIHKPLDGSASAPMPDPESER